MGFEFSIIGDGEVGGEVGFGRVQDRIRQIDLACGRLAGCLQQMTHFDQIVL